MCSAVTAAQYGLAVSQVVNSPMGLEATVTDSKALSHHPPLMKIYQSRITPLEPIISFGFFHSFRKWVSFCYVSGTVLSVMDTK